MRRDLKLWAPAVLLLLIVLGAALAPLLTTTGPAAQQDVVGTRFLTPGTTDPYGIWHPLGTDRLGRDVWSRLLYGARLSLIVGALAVLLSTTIGLGVGVAAGAVRRLPRALLLGATDFTLALPRVVLLLLLASLWEPNAVLVVVVLGLTGWMSIARLVYGESRTVMAQPFVESASALGAGRARLIARHILPNVLSPAIVASALGFGNAIMLEAGLSFLGVGVQPPSSSWGTMIASGRDTLVNAPWVSLAPGIALVAVVVSSTLLSDSLQDRLDPTRRQVVPRDA